MKYPIILIFLLIPVTFASPVNTTETVINETTTAEPTVIDADLQEETRDLRNSESDESSTNAPIHAQHDGQDEKNVSSTTESLMIETDQHASDKVDQNITTDENSASSLIYDRTEDIDGSGSEDDAPPMPSMLQASYLQIRRPEELRLPDQEEYAHAVAGQFTLKTHHDRFLRAISSGEVNSAPHSKECERWYIEAHGDKVVSLRPYCAPGKYLRDNQDGSVNLSDSRELWRPVRRDGNSWSFQSNHGRFLSAFSGGAVFTVKMDQIDECQNFKLEPWTESSIVGQQMIKSHHGTFLLADSRVAFSSFKHPCKKWYIDAHGDKVTLKPYCAPEMYLRANSDGSVDLSLERDASTMWKAVRKGELWALQGFHSGFLCANRTSVDTIAKRIDDWELFRFESWAGNGIAINFITEHFLPPAPVNLSIVGYGPGHRIRVVGMPSQNSTIFSVNLRTHAGIALHLNVRVQQGFFVINSFRENGWQREFRFVDQFPFKRGTTFTIDLVAVDEYINVFINGRMFSRFQEREDTSLINILEVVGDSPGEVLVHSIQYSMK